MKPITIIYSYQNKFDKKLKKKFEQDAKRLKKKFKEQNAKKINSKI